MKVVIIGCGNVGMSYAYAIVNNSTRVDELVLIDINIEKVKGEVLDLQSALPFSSSKMKIKVGTYEDCNNADIICINAGRNQEVGETRLDLIQKNTLVFKDILSNVRQTNFNGIYIISTNPVDVMSYVTYKFTGNAKKVIGSGTTLDTARLKHIISEKLEINPRNIHAYVLGEHGDSEMIPWSKATVGVKDIKDYLTKQEQEEIQEQVKNSAYNIINKKGNTSYGIGVCLLKITETLLNNESSILTVSTYNKEHDVFISLPTIVDRNGVREIVPVNFTEHEEKQFLNSVDVIKQAIKSVDLN